jgi:hypothetical protein
MKDQLCQKDPSLLSKMVNENNDFTPHPADILKDVLT